VIEIYLKTNTNYEMNGNITLTPISCTYKASEYLFTLEHQIDDIGRWKYLDYENVISVEEDGKKKLYRIFNVVKSLYSITAYARPLFFDLIDNILLDVRPTLKNGEEALNIILEGTGFTGHSNISTINTSYYVRKNIVESILGNDENSFLNRWGGEVLLDNFDIYINDKIGVDNGVRVELGYNLNEIEEDINIEEVATRIIPTGYNGIMLDSSTPWVDSPLINKYTKPKMRVINFDDVKVKESETDEEGFNTIEEARAELVKRCNKLYEEGIDKPSVNYKIDMINLANTTAYKDYIKLVTVNEGDTVTCYIPGLDIDVKARVIDFVKDLITGEYISLELGNVQNNFFNNQADLQNRVDSILNSNGTVKADMLNGAINALNTKFKAQRDVAQPQQVRAILFEDRVEGSPTFGCMCIGTMGFEIADGFKPGTEEWDFRTFGTGAGFVADCIVAGTLRAIVLESMDGSCRINLADGIVNIAKGIIKGLGMEINLDRGYISTSATIANEIFEVMLSNGGIRSNHSLSLDAKDRMSIESTGNWIYLLCQQGDDSTKWSNILMTKDSVNITADGGGSGRVLINGKNGVEINGREITSTLNNIETVMLRSEGII
jgi:phage minor structural protein